MNPSHKQKKSKEPDTPQWYIDAYLEALKHGLGVVVIRLNEEPEHIPVNRYPELIDALKWKISND